MRRILLLAVLFLSFITSCSKAEKPNIFFEIEQNIIIELEENTTYYDFSEYVKVYKDERLIDYNELTIYSESGIIKEGFNTFVVEYVYNSVKYENKFIVFFTNISLTVKVYYGSIIKEYNIKKGTTISLPEVYSIAGENLEIEGYYTDEAYQNKFNLNNTIDKSLSLYAKFRYNINYQPSAIDKATIASSLNSYINNLMSTTKSYIPSWNKEGFKGRWNYIDGVFLNSIVNLYNETNNIHYKDFFLNYIDYYIDEAGNFINPVDLSNGFRATELDSICESRILFDAYEMTNNTKYINAIETTYSALMAMPKCQNTDNFWHKTSYENQIWLDGMYMYAPFLARYAKMNENDEAFNLIKKQYEYIRNNMFDENKKLYYHGHDTTKSIFWADSLTGNSQNFWLRSNGWFIVSIVDVLEYFPEGSNREYLKEILNEAILGLLKYQDETTNLFFQLIDKEATAYYIDSSYLNSLKNTSQNTIYKNYIESSGSAMIAYTLLKAARLGYIDISYKDIGKAIFEGLYDYSFKNNCLNNICITAGLGPNNKKYRDGSIAYYLAEPVGSDDAKGVGPFLMAYIEWNKC